MIAVRRHIRALRVFRIEALWEAEPPGSVSCRPNSSQDTGRLGGVRSSGRIGIPDSPMVRQML